MCFRPQTVFKPIMCPACGAKNHPEAKNCTKCNAELKDSTQKP